MTAIAEPELLVPAEWLNAPKDEFLGSTEPRIYTKPLRELTKETSLGFECIAFGAIVLGVKFDPWQAWFLVHALELREDGSFRFRTVVLLVARQNGKTTVMRALTMWAMFTGRVKLVIGTAQDLDVAREVWDAVREHILEDPELAAECPRGYIVTANGKERIKLANGSRYKIKATNDDAARGIPGVGLLLLDELRTHKDYGPYAALANTTMAVPNALIVAMSNAGTADSVVLNELWELGRSDAALAPGEASDPTLGVFGWCAPTDDLDDRQGWADANPSLGYGRLTMRALESARAKARKSLKAAAIFLVENMCRWVETMDFAIDPAAWKGSIHLAAVADHQAGPWYGSVDVSLDGQHVAVVIATPDETGALRAWVASAWDDVETARAELPGVLKALKLKRLGWCPAGPSAELGAVIRGAGRKAGSLRGTELVEYQGVKLSEATMGLAGAVKARQVWHQDEALLNAQIAGCAKLWQGDRYVFTRRGAGHVDAVYALAMAVHVTMTATKRRPWGQDAPQAADDHGADPAPVPF